MVTLIILAILYILFIIGILAVVGSNRRAKTNMQEYYWKQGKQDPWSEAEIKKSTSK